MSDAAEQKTLQRPRDHQPPLHDKSRFQHPGMAKGPAHGKMAVPSRMGCVMECSPRKRWTKDAFCFLHWCVLPVNSHSLNSSVPFLRLLRMRLYSLKIMAVSCTGRL